MNISAKKIYLYLLFSFALAWGVWIASYFLGLSALIVQLSSAAVMWAPAGAVWLTRLMTGKERMLAFSMKPKIRGNVRTYLLAWLFPILAVILGAALYFLVFPRDFDASFSAFNQLLSQVDANSLPISLPMLAALQIIASLIYGPFINTFFALGEEIGWRGFLFPALARRFSNLKAHLLAGLIWGLWHTPINMMGHNYGLFYPGYPWAGVVAMCIFTFSAGVFLSWLSERSGSVWPAALAHGSINAAAGIPMLFSAADSSRQLFGPAVSGLIAGVPLLAAAIIILYRDSKRRPA